MLNYWCITRTIIRVNTVVSKYFSLRIKIHYKFILSVHIQSVQYFITIINAARYKYTLQAELPQPGR